MEYELDVSNSQFVDEINSLIKKSFGYFYKGNYHIIGGHNSTLDDGSLFPPFKKRGLEFIAKPVFLMDPQCGYGVVGLAGNGEKNPSDGSVIVIRKDKEKYIQGAEKYAKLYKEKFNKDVKIIYVENFRDLVDCEGPLSKSPFPKDFGFNHK
jgi:hypothetical protein